jgi:hypothetical protein
LAEALGDPAFLQRRHVRRRLEVVLDHRLGLDPGREQERRDHDAGAVLARRAVHEHGPLVRGRGEVDRTGHPFGDLVEDPLVQREEVGFGRKVRGHRRAVDLVVADPGRRAPLEREALDLTT